MKKYDLFLVVLYILPAIIMMSIGISAISHPRSLDKEEADFYFADLQKQTVNTVVIRGTDLELTVIKKSLASGCDFELGGAMSIHYVSDFRISGDTLFIGDRNIESRDLKLQVADHVQVDTIHAPNVVLIQKTEEE